MIAWETGTSGAQLAFVGDTVVKTCPDGRVDVCQRLKEQAQFMREVGVAAFPRVYDVGDRSYTMEKLEKLGDRSPDGFLSMRRVLADRVWGKRSIVRFGSVITDDHIKKVDGLAGDMRELLRFVRGEMWNFSVVQCARIHGDPTMENAMERKGATVFIDPIPCSSAIPPLMAVDLGKMLQSSAGYETARGRADLGPTHKDLDNQEAILHDISIADVMASRYFMVVHMLRLIPYQPIDLVPKMERIMMMAVSRGILRH